MSDTSNLVERFVGTWRCVGGHATDDDGKTTLVLDDGLLTYTPEGRVHVLVSCDPARSEPTALASIGSCFGYAGTFTVDASSSVVQHHLTHSTQSVWAGRTLPRRFEFHDGGRALRLRANLDHQVSHAHAWQGGGAVIEWVRTTNAVGPARAV